MISLFVALTLLTGVPAQLAIPSPLPDPPAPSTGDGIGPYKSQSAGPGDYATKTSFQLLAQAAGVAGLGNAKRNMEHYLDNTGTVFYNDPLAIMSAIPALKDAVKALAQNAATAKYKSLPNAGSGSFQTPWQGFYATKELSQDWFYALGGFSYSVTGVVSKAPNAIPLKYKVHVFDRYNWDGGKSVTIGSVTVTDEAVGRLHLVGLAREYIVRGSTAEIPVQSFKPGTVIPDPPKPGGRSR